MKGLDHLADVCAASFPAPMPDGLSILRTVPDLSLSTSGDRIRLDWEPPNPALTLALMGVPGVELFERRGDALHRLGLRLPAFDVAVRPRSTAFARAVVPKRLDAEPAPTSELPARGRVELTLVRSQTVRPATALLCELPALADWADEALTDEIAELRGALDDRRALVMGSRLPTIRGAVRLWGKRLLIPLGLAPAPELDETVLRGALGLDDAGVGLWLTEGVEEVPADALNPLSRAAIRLATAEGTWTP